MAALPSPPKKKKNVAKKLNNFVCQIFGEGGFLVVNVTLTLIFSKLFNDPPVHYADSYPIYIQ